VVIFLILRSKIKKITTHSLFYFAAEGGEILLRQPRQGFLVALGKAPRNYREEQRSPNVF
jgi:hypothetical protein